MHYLKKGLQTTITSIQKHKLLFLIILFLQIIFVASSLTLGAQYLIKILEDTQGIIGPLENANYDSQKIEQGEPFVPDYTAIYNSYQSMLKNVFSFCLWIAVLFLFLNGGIWLFSHWMLQEPKSWKLRMKEGLQFFLKYWASAFLLLGTFDLISYYVLIHFIRLSQSFSSITFVLKILLVFLLVVYYFFLVALAAAPSSPWKKFPTIWINLSVKKIRKTAMLFLAILLTLFATLAVLYAGIEYTESVTLLLLVGLISIIMMVVTRIFWIAAMREIEHETSHH